MGPSGSGIHDCIGIGHPASCTDLQYHRHPQLKLYRNLTVLVQFGLYAIISNFKTLSRIREYPNKVAFHSFYRFKIQSTKILKTNSFFFFWISSVSTYHGRFLAALEVDISVQGWGDRTRWWGCCLMNSSEESTPNSGSLNGPHKFGCMGNLPHHSKLAWILLLLHKHLKTE